MSVKSASLLTFGALLAFMLCQPPIGALSDNIGRRCLMLIFGAGITLFTIPLNNPSNPGAYLNALFCIDLYCAAYHQLIHRDSWHIECGDAPPELRALGVARPYAIANALFGGSA